MALKGTQFYQHSQTSASTSWVITHNLGVAELAVDVVVDEGGNREKILPLDVVMTDDNTLTITFSSARTGSARISG